MSLICFLQPPFKYVFSAADVMKAVWLVEAIISNVYQKAIKYFIDIKNMHDFIFITEEINRWKDYAGGAQVKKNAVLNEDTIDTDH